MKRAQGRWATLRRGLTLLVVLTLLGLLVPNAGRAPTEVSLVKVEGASGLDTEPGVVWILALGSDARPGEPVLRSRSDAIQLVGMNPRTGDATVIGIPRDSYVTIPGFGQDKINSAMVYGGPQLAARAVAQMVGITPDYVFTTSFVGFRRMVYRIGGVRVLSRHAYTEPLVRIRRGFNSLDGLQSLVFVRQRYALPNGDFDRSRNQGRFLFDGLRTVQALTQDSGQLERILSVFAEKTDIDIGPVELYRLAHGVLQVDPAKVTLCVVRGSAGMAGSASVVFADIAYARRIAGRARADARLEGGC
jgi:LCP family protein required for cell wall assembly